MIFYFFVVVNIWWWLWRWFDDDFGDDDLLMYGCKYLMIQMVGFSEDIIWWWELYNIELWIMHCRVFTC